MAHLSKRIWLCLALATLGGVINVSAQTRNAALTAHGRSVSLAPSGAVNVPGVGVVTTYFSTFNGTTGTLLSSSGFVSGELRPRSSPPGLYEGGYAQVTPLVVFDYGSYALPIPTTDVDGNGIPDAIQYDRDGNFTANGSGFSASAGLTFSISVRFFRAAGAASGTYTATTQNSLGQANSVSGAYRLTSYQGSISYTRGSTNTMSVSATLLSDPTTVLTGSTSFTVTSTDQVSYPAFTLRNNSGTSYSVRAGTLTRSSNVYRGNFSLIDGLPQTSWADFTEYALSITDTNDADGNGIPDFSDPTATPPVITTQPRATSATVGQAVSLSVVDTGATSYQWTKNGADILGATAATLSFPSAQLSDSGTYAVRVSNSAGSATSSAIALTIAAAPAAPSFRAQPYSLAVVAGQTVVLAVDVTGNPTPTLQWRKDGSPIAGAINGILVLPTVTAVTSGNYTCLATNTSGTVTSSVSAVSVVESNTPGRLINLSILSALDTAIPSMTMGAVVGGNGTRGTIPFLYRAVGPSLAAFGVSGSHTDPQLDVFAGATQVGTNNDWGGVQAIADTSTLVGAFGLSGTTSRDAALLAAAVPIGDTSVRISGVGSANGTVLAEIYDATSPSLRSSTTPRLVNVSLLKRISAGGDVTVGFVLGGSTATTVLIRAVGPTLGQFGVTDVMSDPQLSLFQSGSASPRATNDNWGQPSTIYNTFASVGAFPLTNGSRDAAMLASLPPGAYSVQISNVANSAGSMLAEVYEVPTVPPLPTNITSGLVAYYPFNGSVTDESGNGNHPTPAGSFQYLSNGLSGSALRINGDNALFYTNGGHVRLPNFTSSLNSGFTLSLWVKDEILGGSPVNEEAYISFGILDLPKAEIALNSVTRAIRFVMDSGQPGAAREISKSVSIPSDYVIWKHLVLTYTPGRMAAYYNGEKVGETTATFNVFPTSNAALGRHWWSGGGSSSARMSVTYDNVRIYNRSLTDADVQTLYLAEKP